MLHPSCHLLAIPGMALALKRFFHGIQDIHFLLDIFSIHFVDILNSLYFLPESTKVG